MMNAVPTADPTGRDATLLAGLRAGDGRAFEDLLARHARPLLRLARRMLGSEEDARDALQDAMVAVCRSIHTFESQCQLSTWLYRIVVNVCLMRLRARRRRPEEAIDDHLPRFRDDGHQVEPCIPWTETAEAVVERSQLREAVRACIEKLPESYRLVLQLRDVEGLSTEEAAEILGITPNAAKIRLHRARQALRTLIDPLMRPVTP